MKRLAGAAAVVAFALTSFGCGSDGSREESQLLPRVLSADLIRRSELIRATLEGGDGCTARQQAKELGAAVVRSIDQNRVPPELGGELRRRSADLADSIVCVQPPPPPPPPPRADEDGDDDDDERGKKDDRAEKDDRGKKDDHGKEDD